MAASKDIRILPSVTRWKTSPRKGERASCGCGMRCPRQRRSVRHARSGSPFREQDLLLMILLSLSAVTSRIAIRGRQYTPCRVPSQVRTSTQQGRRASRCSSCNTRFVAVPSIAAAAKGFAVLVSAWNKSSNMLPPALTSFILISDCTGRPVSSRSALPFPRRPTAPSPAVASPLYEPLCLRGCFSPRSGRKSAIVPPPRPHPDLKCPCFCPRLDFCCSQQRVRGLSLQILFGGEDTCPGHKPFTTHAFTKPERLKNDSKTTKCQSPTSQTRHSQNLAGMGEDRGLNVCRRSWARCSRL